MNILNKIFNRPTSTCRYCHKKRHIVNVEINCDLVSTEINASEYLDLCKNCLFNLANKKIMMISLYSLTRVSVLKLLDKDDLSERGGQSLKEMQKTLQEERKYRLLNLKQN